MYLELTVYYEMSSVDVKPHPTVVHMTGQQQCHPYMVFASTFFNFQMAITLQNTDNSQCLSMQRRRWILP